MEKSPFTTFDVDKSNHKIIIKRDFAAKKELVWKAWTTSEILDTWWAPKPYEAVTQTMDFTVGGFWLYYMLSPEGERHWGRADFRAIDPGNGFVTYDAFCDEEGNIDGDLPRTLWHVNFLAEGESTSMEIELEFDDLDDLEKTLEMGFQEGFTMGLSNLDEVLAKME